MADNKLTYTKAISELEEIVKSIENEDVEVDNLIEKVKRASFLIKYCKEKLRDTEKEVKQVLSSLEEEKAED
ncbi:MAG: exodeoxyribonuclease VII small subunit [Candidatus Omnitrophica bacterium]|nr:exodeoxyribonuclease VII small subunit [Candidatus Omnitrophota bacterium]MCM8829548.1 exodeoxyribonuclease VII small subunit [Candidatus Omnitrophota bacterium]